MLSSSSYTAVSPPDDRWQNAIDDRDETQKTEDIKKMMLDSICNENTFCPKTFEKMLCMAEERLRNLSPTLTETPVTKVYAEKLVETINNPRVYMSGDINNIARAVSGKEPVLYLYDVIIKPKAEISSGCSIM